jgi:Fe-S oxidoreductase
LFNEKTCQRCGICLEKCHFLQLPIEKAKEEILRMIETRTSSIINQNCAVCAYCDVICPTQSNPSALRREIKLRHFKETGVSKLRLYADDNPHNLKSICLEIDSEQKSKDIQIYTNPPKNGEMFYIGCGLPSFFPDLVKSKLLEDLPLVGGLEYCCKGYVYDLFGESEARLTGLELSNKFKALEIEKLISFCPGCEDMIKNVYPSIVNGFNVDCQNIIEYLLAKYHKGEITFTNKITKRITFQDPCNWRNLERKVYEGPRELLEILGAEVVEMKHKKEHSLCCGAPVTESNRPLGMKIAKTRVEEAKEVEADAIAYICHGCLMGLAKDALAKNIESYYITELVQMAIGETPYHKIVESLDQIINHLLKKVIENPNLRKEKYIIKDGRITCITGARAR